MNLLLITVDCLRSDHVSFYGYDRITTPNIDELAKESIVFENVISTIPRTHPSFASIFTAKYPHNHGVRFMGNKLSKENLTLAKILQNEGYYTGANAVELNKTGLDQGFNEFNPISRRIVNKLRRGIRRIIKPSEKVFPAEEITRDAIKWIAKNKNKNFFLFLHYMGAHWPYQAPPSYENYFDDSQDDHIFNNLDHGKISRGDLIFNNSLPQSQIRHAIAHYDGCIRYIDSKIKEIIDFLRTEGIFDETILVITADHGESLGENGYYFQHGEFLYDVTLKVPLIIRVPNYTPRKIDSQISNIDIMPTILDLMKVGYSSRFDGRSTLDLINKGDSYTFREYAFSESGRSVFRQNKKTKLTGIKGKWRSIRTRQWKLICIPNEKENEFELYNLLDDPYEANNIYGKEPSVERELKEKLFDWMKPEKSDDEPDVIEEEFKKRLISLGYMD